VVRLGAPISIPAWLAILAAEPNKTMRVAVARIHDYARAAGRDPNAIGLEPQLNDGRGHPDKWRAFLAGWRDRSVGGQGRVFPVGPLRHRGFVGPDLFPTQQGGDEDPHRRAHACLAVDDRLPLR
jgi:hypothetical protein